MGHPSTEVIQALDNSVNATTEAKLRQSIDSSNNIHAFSTSVSGSNVTISMTATNTANISEDRRYVYDVEFTQSDTTTVEKMGMDLGINSCPC